MAVKLPKGAKPSKVVSRDGTRPELQQTVLEKEGEDWVLYATDSYRFIRLPVDVDGDAGLGPISREAMIAAEKTGWFDVHEFVEPLGKGGAANGGMLFRRPTGSPEWAKKWEKLQPTVKKKDEFTVAFNARFLFEIAQALGAGEVVEVTFDTASELRTITVRPPKGSTLGGEALLMPVRRNA